MRSGWHCVLWLCAAVSLARSLDQDGWIGEALDLYNQREDVLYLYRALEDLPGGPEQKEKNSRKLRIEIMETTCLKSERRNAARCQYKPDGDRKMCNVQLTDPDIKEIQCDHVTKVSRRKRPIGFPGSNTVLGIP
ncbi:cathelicidin-6-like [Mantella aurantiaca]